MFILCKNECCSTLERRSTFRLLLIRSLFNVGFFAFNICFGNQTQETRLSHPATVCLTFVAVVAGRLLLAVEVERGHGVHLFLIVVVAAAHRAAAVLHGRAAAALAHDHAVVHWGEGGRLVEKGKGRDEEKRREGGC